MRCILVAVIVLSAALWAAESNEQQNRDPNGQGNSASAEQTKPAEPARQFGDAAVSRFVKVGDGFSFVCCVDGWPDVVGKDITVIIGKIAPPGPLGEDGKSFYDKQLAKYMQEHLAGGTVELCNITRAADKFALVADVKVDGRYLAAELIKQGFAKAIEPPSPLQPQQAGEPAQTPPAPTQQQSDPKVAGDTAPAPTDAKAAAFVASKNSDLFHKIECSSAKRITEKNALYFKTAEEADAAGKKPCARCKPE